MTGMNAETRSVVSRGIDLSDVVFPEGFTVLVDMDGVIADWQKQYDTLLSKQFPHIPIIPFDQITSFKTQNFYADEHRVDISKMMNTPGFYRDLEPISGAVDALHAMEAAGITVFLCTAPYVTHETCASEKMGWVKEHLGERWLNRTVITSDKTLVRGDVLIDDKPNIKGAMKPLWKHIVFDAPYNRGMEPRIDNWVEWQNVLAEVVKSAE